MADGHDTSSMCIIREWCEITPMKYQLS